MTTRQRIWLLTLTLGLMLGQVGVPGAEEKPGVRRQKKSKKILPKIPREPREPKEPNLPREPREPIFRTERGRLRGPHL